MNTFNLRKRRCFKFQVQECQNASIENYIEAVKSSLKIPISSEDMDKMQTEFPQKRMHKWWGWCKGKGKKQKKEH